MISGQPFNFNTLLAPYGLSTDDFYVFLAAFAAFFTVVFIGKGLVIKNDYSSRIKLLQERRQQLKNELSAPRKRAKRREESLNIIRKIVDRFHLLKRSQMSDLQATLVSAGIRSRDALTVFAFAKAVVPLILFVISLFFVEVHTESGGLSWKLGLPLMALYFGLKLPGMYVSRKRKKRYLLIQRSLADTLDLLMICAEAGLSLAQGLDRVGRELKVPYPEMADELGLTSIELSFQPDRQKTLSGLADRVQLPEVKGLVNVLIQTEKYGTPISQALRTLSHEFRTQRMLRAEQKAARLPAIMTVPMILFILPTLFIVVLAPAIINLLDATR